MSAIVRACLLSIFCACTTAHAALAQTLGDPTRPPSVTAGAAGAETVESEAPRQLQSILFSRGRKVAVIDGQAVGLGAQIGDAVVAKISESEVVLKYPDRVETLKLLGGVERKPVGAAPVKGAKSSKP